MNGYETIVLLAALGLAAFAMVCDVGDNALVLVLVTNVFAFMAGKKYGEGSH